MLGDFEIRREIGRGGMGTVYEAWQATLSRTVAVKVLDRQVSASKVAVARFQREAQAAAKLHHPHIVPIFAQGSKDGTYYYAMEYVDGESLGALIHHTKTPQMTDTATTDLDETLVIERGRVQPERTAKTAAAPPSGVAGMNDSNVTLSAVRGQPVSRDAFRAIARHIADVANALAYAHEQGVVHRDIKPHNLLLGSDGRLRITDFGLARLAEQPGVTMTGELVGSPLYMSPEQIMGSPGEVDHRTDIYSLGATLYEWLALTPPFPGETRERVISLIMTAEPPPARVHNPNIPPELETICTKALERDPARRYQRAGELRDDLRRFLDGRPIKARRAGFAIRILKALRRHQVASMAVLALAIAVTLASALFRTHSRIAKESQAAAVAKGQTEDILDVLGPELLALMRSAEAVRGLVGSTPDGDTAADGGAVSSGPAFSVGTPTAIARRGAREYYEAVTPSDWIATQRTLSEADNGQPDALLINLEMANRRWRAGEPGEALALLSAYLSARPNDDAARQMDAALCAERGEFARMAQDAAVMVRLDGQSVHAYLWRGIAHLLLDDLDHAVVDLGRATELDPRSVWAKVMLGLTKIGRGRAPGALLDFEDVLRADKDLVVALLGRASAYAAGGQFEEAVSDANAVLRSEPDNADAVTIRGDCYASLGRYAEAAADYQVAMDIVGKTPELGLRFLTALVQQQRLSQSRVPSASGADPTDRAPSALEPHVNKSNEGASAAPVVDWLSRLVRP